MIGAAWDINSTIILMSKWCNPIVSSSNLGILGSVPGIEVPYLSTSTPGMIGSIYHILLLCLPLSSVQRNQSLQQILVLLNFGV